MGSQGRSGSPQQVARSVACVSDSQQALVQATSTGADSTRRIRSSQRERSTPFHWGQPKRHCTITNARIAACLNIRGNDTRAGDGGFSARIARFVK